MCRLSINKFIWQKDTSNVLASNAYWILNGERFFRLCIYMIFVKWHHVHSLNVYIHQSQIIHVHLDVIFVVHVNRDIVQNDARPIIRRYSLTSIRSRIFHKMLINEFYCVSPAAEQRFNNFFTQSFLKLENMYYVAAAGKTPISDIWTVIKNNNYSWRKCLSYDGTLRIYQLCFRSIAMLGIR